MAIQFKELDIPEIICIEPDIYCDERGFFAKNYKSPEFQENGIKSSFVQVNHSKSSKGILRELHYQKNPMAQGKLVSVVFGEVFDVAVDLRVGSPTYGKWVSARLSSSNGHLLYVPPGFAHGFLATSPFAGVMYQVTAEYAPDLDRGIRWDDPQVCVDWPISNPQLSAKDVTLPLLSEAENNFRMPL